MIDCDDYVEEILPDGTRIRTITKKDGSVVRKVVHETEGQKKLREMKELVSEQNGLNNEAAVLELQQRNLNLKAEKLQKLKEQEEMLSKKEEFKPPGIDAKIY